MLEKQAELFGELTAKTHKAERAITEASIARALDEARGHVGKIRQEIDNRLDQIENDFRDTEHELGQAVERQYQAMGARIDGVVLEQADRQRRVEESIAELKAQEIAEVLKRVDEIDNALSDAVHGFKETTMAAYLEELEKLSAQIKSQESFETMLTERLEQIRDGEKGEKGEKGDPGEPGLDRPLIEPVVLKPDIDYQKGVLGVHNGGLWISTKRAIGSPDDDPHAWTCILDSMDSLSIDLQEDKSYKLSVRMATGKEIESVFKIPFPEHKGIWQDGSYAKGEIVTKGHSLWMAIEDTDGEPPGNGWQQILTAPRGKTGPPGKSIIGPQGKPGRNGRDAVLPDNFVEDIYALANKAFEDGRSGAEAITSYRGYFRSGESLNRGDLVTSNEGLYICTSSGSHSAISKDAFELMLAAPSMPASGGGMVWTGDWQSKKYNAGMVVRDGPWTMVANKRTDERAGPVDIGEPYYYYTGTIGSAQQVAAFLLMGNRYIYSSGSRYITGFRINVISGFDYNAYIVIDPLGVKQVRNLGRHRATVTDWVQFNTQPLFIAPGQLFDMILTVTAVDDTPVTWSGSWYYDTPPNQAIPPAGSVIHANSEIDVLRVAKTDNDGGDRSTELLAINVGDEISEGTLKWTVTAISEEASYVAFNVLPAIQGAADGLRDFVFSTTTPTPIDYSVDVDFWQTSGSSVTGLYIADGKYDDIAVNDNAYGIDILIQDAYVSPDWDLIAYSDIG